MQKYPHVKLITVELQQGQRPFATEATAKFRTVHEIWHKENMINKAVELLPMNWKYVAWIDADIEFQRDDWDLEALHQLQHYDIIQLWSTAIDMGPTGEALTIHAGFGSQYAKGAVWNPPGTKYAKFWHPGYAWACTRKAWEAMGGLIDFAILGSADHHMALAWIGKVRCSMNHDLHENYKKLLLIYQDRCEQHLKRNIGGLDGTILHHWHGTKKNRRYKERWQILVDHKFDPLLDIKRDWQGLYQLEGNKPGLRDDLRMYFRCRNEDSIDTD